MTDNYQGNQYQLRKNDGYYSRIVIATANKNEFFKLNDYLINEGDALNCNLIKDKAFSNYSFIVELPSQKNVLDIIVNISDDTYIPTLFGLTLNNYRYIHIIYDSKHHGSCGEFYYSGNGVIMDWRIAYNDNNVSNIRDLIDSEFVTYRIIQKKSLRMMPVGYLNDKSKQELDELDCSNSFLLDKKLGDDVIKIFFNNDIPF